MAKKKEDKIEAPKGGLKPADFLALMKKEFKKETTTMLSAEGAGGVTEWGDTGICVMNYCHTGQLDKGLPFGRCAEYFGGESTGKSLIAMYQAAYVQKLGGTVYYVDSECSLDRTFAKMQGVNPDELLYDDGIKTVEKFQEKLDQLCKIKVQTGDKTPMLVILDSVGMLSTDYEMEKMDGSDRTKARELKKMVRRLTNDMHKTNLALFIVNHMYDNVNATMPGAPKKLVGGGSGIKYLATLRDELKVIKKHKDAKTNEVIAQDIQVTSVKNKLTRPFRQAVFTFDFNQVTIDRYSGLGELLYKKGIVEKTKIGVFGAYEYKGEKVKTKDFGKFVQEKNLVPEFNAALKAYDERHLEEKVEGPVDSAVLEDED